MSSYIFPSLPGARWGRPWRPMFRTLVQESVSGNESRTTMQSYPIYSFELAYDVLRAEAGLEELQKIMGFFLYHRAAWDSWLFDNPDDNTTAVEQTLGTGNGVQTQYQLVRSIGYAPWLTIEPVQNVNVLGTVKVAGVAKTEGTHFTRSATGLLTFGTAPTAGQAVTWVPGSWYYRCRFMEDELGTEKFAKDLFELKRVRFKGAIGNKV
jgi:uncharacterized protein (TIGR02217 family)